MTIKMLISSILLSMMYLQIHGIAFQQIDNGKWKSNLGRKGCEDCLITRNYYCKKNDNCKTTWYTENIYKSFTRNCFGVGQLNSDTVEEFMRLLRAGNKSWVDPLQDLLNVIDQLGLWSNSNYLIYNGCQFLPPSSLVNAVHERNLLEQSIDKLWNDFVQSHQPFSSCYFASTVYFCPLNKTMIWKKRFRLCNSHNLKEIVKCDCSDNSNFQGTNFSCKKTDMTCSNEPCALCPCTAKAVTTSIYNSGTTLNTSYYSITRITNLVKATTMKSSLDVSSKLRNEWKIIAIILCACVILLFAVIIFYACWRINRPSNSSTKTDVVNSAHVTDTSARNDVSVFSSQPPTQPDSRYFCIGENNDGLYHTIAPSIRSTPVLSASTTPPPLPLRLFSLSSATDDASTRSWPRAPPPPVGQAAASAANKETADNVYGYIETEEPEKQYEIPIPCGQMHIDDINDYNNENVGQDEEVRVNPLYASTSEDEL